MAGKGCKDDNSVVKMTYKQLEIVQSINKTICNNRSTGKTTLPVILNLELVNLAILARPQ